jgi:hypothetical protein
VASRRPSMPLPTPWHHRPTLDVAPRAPRDNPHTAYTQAITESRRPLRRVRGRAHHSGEGRRAPRAEGAGGNAPFPPPGTPGPPRTSRPAQPPTHRIHTSNHRQSAATPPCAGPGLPRWRGAHQTRSPAQAQGQGPHPPPSTPWQTGEREGGRAAAPHQPQPAPFRAGCITTPETRYFNAKGHRGRHKEANKEDACGGRGMGTWQNCHVEPVSAPRFGAQALDRWGQRGTAAAAAGMLSFGPDSVLKTL